jgi:hypothetical protein
VRALLLSLLLANVLYFAWATWIDSPRPAPAMAGTSLPDLQVLPAVPTLGQAAPASAPSAPAGATTPAADAPPTAAAPAAVRCNSIGPLPDAETSRGVQVALEARKLSGRERTAVVEELEGYWVHIDHLGEESARQRAIHRLQGAGIHGAVALADTSQVSVGLFSEQESATQRAAAVVKAGYKAEVGPRNHAVTRYWLDVEAPQAVPLPAVDALLGGSKEAVAPTWQPCANAGAGTGAGNGAGAGTSAAPPAASGSTAPPPPATAR